MKIKKIIIINTEWTIKILPQLDCSLFETNGDTYSGKTNYSTKEIIIAEGLSSTRFYEVLIHELTHAVILQLMLGKENFTQEEVCEFMERYCGYIYDLANEICKEVEA